MTRRWTWIVAVLGVVAAGTWTSHSFHRASDVSVTSAVVTRGPIVRAIVATGTLQPVSAVQVGAQISGTIDALDADYNSIVHKGQIDGPLREGDLLVTSASIEPHSAPR